MRPLPLLLAFCWGVPFLARAAEPPPETAAPAPAAPAPDAASYSAKLDELWKTRDGADAAKLNDDVIAEGLKAFPTDYEILWRAGRFRWWVADGLTEAKLKKQVGKESWNFGKRAVEAKPDGAEGRYFLALGIGAYSQGVGILAALTEGLEGKFLENIEFALKHNEDFERAGGHTAKGRYHWELPWPKRNLTKSREELKKSIDKHPEHLRNYYFLADTCLKDGDLKGAKAAIDQALNGSEAYDPPEARRIKAWAKVLAQKIEAENK